MAKAKLAVRKVKQVQVFNPKVEQVVRAIYFGFDGGANVLSVSALNGAAITYFAPDDLIDVGIADAKGYRLNPESNSALITMGYHPTAVLLWLTQMRLKGEPVVMVHNDRLVAVHAAVVQCARDVVFNYEKLAMIKRKPVVVSRPILENYRVNGKPELFA